MDKELWIIACDIIAFMGITMTSLILYRTGGTISKAVSKMLFVIGIEILFASTSIIILFYLERKDLYIITKIIGRLCELGSVVIFLLFLTKLNGTKSE